MNIKKLIIGLFILWGSQCFSQKQGNIWYFGGYDLDSNTYTAGLDFNSGFPVPILNSVMPSTYGCAAYCNSAGELIFYSDGLTVYDRSHHVMENGDSLGGDPFTPQSVLIVPFPTDTNLYYIFTNDKYTPENPSETGLHYSIINMNLNNGLGGVLNPKATGLIEKNNGALTGCTHSNGKDFWVISASRDSASLFAILVNESGIQNPIVSNMGLARPLLPRNFEISPKGNKIALKAISIVDSNSYRYILDFDTKTGLFSNPFAIGADTENLGSYNTGCSFSPDGNLFYDFEHVRNNSNGAYQLHQYDLKAFDIVSSKILLSESNYQVFDMQIGPDGKIYYSEDDYSYLNQIENPNIRGLNCNLHKNNIYLGGKKASGVLPNELLYAKKFTSIKSFEKEDRFSLFYNCCLKQLIMNIPDNKNHKFILYNIMGKSILDIKFSNNFQINVSSLAIGLYHYALESENKIMQTGKVLIN
jgi:hypothetical protein